MSEKSRYWYAPKRYGWGWGAPTSWHGWIVLVLLIIAIVVPAHWFIRHGHLRIYLTYVWLLAGVQLLICYLKGPPPRWRWGDSDD
jgi:hypothetical protein